MTIHLHRVMPSESGIGFVFGVESGCIHYFLWASTSYLIYWWGLSISFASPVVVLVLDTNWDDDSSWKLGTCINCTCMYAVNFARKFDTRIMPLSIEVLVRTSTIL